MNVKTDTVGGVSIVRVGETRLMYPILSDFSTAVSGLVSSGKKDILIDLTPVTYVDSATKLSGVQKRVETMLTMTGAQNFIEIHADEPTAVKSFGA
jgi:hypothetical protein